jgi:NAD(P)-dependent dehydrogenase (short-subunit alcohol dehydrogenase family)
MEPEPQDEMRAYSGSEKLDGKVALVTGGAGGLGAATCDALAAAGAQVVVADVDAGRGEAVAERVGGHFVRTDVSDLDANLAAVATAVDRCGGLDLVHLNAGVASFCSLGEDFDPALYRRAMGVNLDGVVFGVHAALPALKARGGGAIVATASLAGLTGVPLDPIYASNKHGVVGLTRSLGPALGADGIRINAVCPGFAESAIVDPIRELLAEQGFKIIPAAAVAAAVMRLFEGDMTGECWFVQPDREPEAFRFRRVPGPGKEVTA